MKSSGDQDRYDRLSQIATTVGVPSGGENYLTTPEQQLTMIATALGVPDAADALQREIDDLFVEAAAHHEQWDGLSVAAATRRNPRPCPRDSSA